MRQRGAGLALALAAAPLGAQETPELRPARFQAGVHLIGAAAVGEFADYIDAGVGLGADFEWPVQPDSWLALRADLGWMLYGSETTEVCFQSTGCLVTLELSTTNNIFFLGAGPQLGPPTGTIRPYLNATGGLAYFATTSSVRGDDSNENFASDTNFDDITLAWTAGGGLMIQVARGRTPVAIDLGAAYHGNGAVEYLTEGDISPNPQPGQPPILDVNRSDANFVSFRLGVTVGFRPNS